jgi:hypothetical protein
LEFPFGLKPKLFIPPDRSAVFFPYFIGAPSDTFLIGRCQFQGSSFQFLRQRRYALSRFPIANPPREVAVFASLG